MWEMFAELSEKSKLQGNVCDNMLALLKKGAVGAMTVWAKGKVEKVHTGCLYWLSPKVAQEGAETCWRGQSQDCNSGPSCNVVCGLVHPCKCHPSESHCPVSSYSHIIKPKLLIHIQCPSRAGPNHHVSYLPNYSPNVPAKLHLTHL